MYLTNIMHIKHTLNIVGMKNAYSEEEKHFLHYV
jgi:hypothetical protein